MVLDIITAIAGIAFTITASLLYPNILYRFKLIDKREGLKKGKSPKKHPRSIWILFWISSIVLIINPIIRNEIKEKNHGLTYEPIDISSYSNWFKFPAYHLTRSLSGTVIFQGVPFDVPSPDEGVIQTRNGILLQQPTNIEIPINKTNIKAVHILLNGGYVRREFKNSEVGYVTLNFNNDLSIRVPIIAGVCLREGWFFKGISEYNSINEINGNKNCINVFGENQIRENKLALAIIDSMSIEIPEPYTSKKLLSISFNDVSAQLVGSENPSLILISITVEYS